MHEPAIKLSDVKPLSQNQVGLAVLGDKPGHGITIDYEELNKSVVNKISVKSGPSPYGRRAGAGLYEVPPTKDEIKEANSK